MKQTLRYFLFVLMCCSLHTGYAQIYSYTSNTSGAYATIAANTTGTALTRVNGVTVPGSICGTGHSSTNFLANTVYSDTLGAIEVQVTPATGYQLQVTGFSADLRRSGSGPVSVRFAYSINGGTTWIDKGSNDAPGTGNCGSTTTSSWSTAFNVAAPASLRFRIYGFNASNLGGTLQILNLLINGTVSSANTITTGAAAFGPYCAGTTNTISVPFTTQGTFTGQYFVQLSDASGVFPANATANLISTGTAASPASATIPSSATAGTGYRVRVVNSAAPYFTSGDNGSNIVINSTVVPSVTIVDSPTAICPGTPVRFTATAVGGGANPTYQWFYHGQVAGTGATYNNAALVNNDSVFVVLTSNATCASPATDTSNVLHVTVYATGSSTVAQTICPGDSVVFGGVTYRTSGSYMASLQTVHGCDSMAMLDLTVLRTVRDTVRTLVCQGDAYAFHGSSYTAAGTYSDSLSCDSIATLVLGYKTVQQVPVTGSLCQGDAFVYRGVTYTAGGNYRDTISCDSIVMLTITAHTRPTATATLTGSASLSTTAFPAYQWLRNGAAITGATAQNYTATQNGNYSVLVTDANGCSDTSNIVAVTTIAISEVDALHANVYPNPTENILHIDADGLQSIELTDMIGRPVMSLPASGSHAQIDISALSHGMYTLILRGADSAVSIRSIIKQ